MPELPEVQSIVDTLAASVNGRRIERVTLGRADYVTPPTIDLPRQLLGRHIRSISRRAKRVVVQLDDGNRFYIHLGMSGRLTVEAPENPTARHTHLILDLDDSRQIRLCDPRRFGGVFWMGANAHENSLGPEPLEMSAGELFSALLKTRRAIKVALLDQKLIAGIGNIYADEALFEASIHPKMRSERISAEQARRLDGAIKRVLRRAIRHKGSTLRDYVNADGQRGAFQKLHRVYGRGGLPCLRCGTNLRRIVLGGRSTVFCPKCQSAKLLTKQINPPIRFPRSARASAAPRE